MSLHYMLMKTHSTLVRKISYRAQKELGLSSGQPKVLDCLMDHEGSDQKTIASICEIEQATLGSILLRMEEKGFIERKQMDGNRRSLFVYLTDTGKELACKMKKIIEEEDAKALRSFSQTEIANLQKTLDILCKNMNQNMEADNDGK